MNIRINPFFYPDKKFNAKHYRILRLEWKIQEDVVRSC